MKIIKLGGAVITSKVKYRKAREETINRLCVEISESREKVIVVCGAGSFGHIVADKYALQAGYEPYHDPPQVLGLVEVSRDVRELNLILMDALAGVGMKPISIPPSVFVMNDDRNMVDEETNSEWFKKFLGRGMTPVTYGDIVPDRSLKFSICSGDQLIYLLSRELKIKDAIFVTNVDGVFDKNPDDKKAKLIAEIDPTKDNDIKYKLGSITDVTGGMGKKVMMAKKMALCGTTTRIINGNVPDRLYKALVAEKVTCTMIKGVSDV